VQTVLNLRLVELGLEALAESEVLEAPHTLAVPASLSLFVTVTVVVVVAQVTVRGGLVVPPGAPRVVVPSWRVLAGVVVLAVRLVGVAVMDVLKSALFFGVLEVDVVLDVTLLALVLLLYFAKLLLVDMG
jgi:hypothetical protein